MTYIKGIANNKDEYRIDKDQKAELRYVLNETPELKPTFSSVEWP